MHAIEHQQKPRGDESSTLRDFASPPCSSVCIRVHLWFPTLILRNRTNKADAI